MKYAPPAEAALRRKDLLERRKHEDEVARKRRKKEQEEIRSLGKTVPGERLRKGYEDKMQSALNKWLEGNPQDATLAILTWQKLNSYREFVRELTPIEETPDGRSKAGS